MIFLALAAIAAQAATAPAPPPPPRPMAPMAAPADEAVLPAPSRVGSTGFLTAASLQSKCQDNSAAMVSACYAYIAGVHDTIRAYETWLNMREFCRPARVSQGELRRAFLEYLTANPRAASGEAASVVVIALRAKFACDAAGPAPQPPEGAHP